MKAYKIWKLDIYSEFEEPLEFIFIDKKIADKVCDDKNMCNDINVLSWIYEVRVFNLIENEEDVIDSDIYSFLEKRTLSERVNIKEWTEED